MNLNRAVDYCYRLMNEHDYDFEIDYNPLKITIYSGGLFVRISPFIRSDMIKSDVDRFIILLAQARGE